MLVSRDLRRAASPPTELVEFTVEETPVLLLDGGWCIGGRCGWEA